MNIYIPINDIYVRYLRTENKQRVAQIIEYKIATFEPQDIWI